MDRRIQQSVLSNLSTRAAAVAAGPFVVGIDPATDNPNINYATPRPGAAITASDVARLVDAFRAAGRKPRLEYVVDCAPGLEALLLAAGFTVEARHEFLTCSPDSLAEMPAAVSGSAVSGSALSGSAVSGSAVSGSAVSGSALSEPSEVAAASGSGVGVPAASQAAVSAASRAGVPAASQVGVPAASRVMRWPAGFEIREPVTRAERAALVAAQGEAFGGEFEVSDADVDRLERLLDRGGFAMMAVAEDGACAGGGQAVPPAEGVSEIAGIAVRAPFRRRGLGGGITAALARRIFDTGADLAWLEASGDESWRVYERIGFRPAGRRLYIAL